ncbi:hypothetical protein EBU99_07700 [bacterium]|nr:hypothetical protein [bacterium]
MSLIPRLWKSADEQGQGDGVGNGEGASIVKRAKRIESHALVDVKMNSWNPFAVSSAVLLDLSWQGFKIEFVNPAKIKPGARLTMWVPLASFGILAPAKLKLKIQVKWYDARMLRAGGIFEPESHEQDYLIQKIIDVLTLRGAPEDAGQFKAPPRAS